MTVKQSSDRECKEAACLWQELAVVYPDLAGRETDPEKKKKQAEQDVIDLFGPEEIQKEG